MDFNGNQTVQGPKDSLWLSCSNSFMKINKSFFMSFGSFNEQNERIDSEKDLFILMNEFEQDSHERASQNRARWPFELIVILQDVNNTGPEALPVSVF